MPQQTTQPIQFTPRLGTTLTTAVREALQLAKENNQPVTLVWWYKEYTVHPNHTAHQTLSAINQALDG